MHGFVIMVGTSRDRRTPPGATIGWHRDAPVFGDVVGVSLASACLLRFQRGLGGERRVFEQALEPRSPINWPDGVAARGSKAFPPSPRNGIRSRSGRSGAACSRESPPAKASTHTMVWGRNRVVTEERLPGGRTSGAVRIGDAVHRPVQPWTPAVHALLRHLESVGFEGAPRVLGFDEQGREVLSLLAGETVGDRRPWPEWTRSDDALRQVGAWLRRLHDVTADFEPPSGLRWFAGQTWRLGLVIGHHDAAPFNAVWCDGRLGGFFDWDTAGPSSRELDLAFVALSWVPLFARRAVAEQGFTAFEDRSRRLHLLLDAYGVGPGRHSFRAAVAGRARVNAAVIERLAAGGDPIYVALRPLAADLEQAATEVEALPESFWEPRRPRTSATGTGTA